MKRKCLLNRLIALGASVLLTSIISTHATPYATAVSAAGGVVSFTLNESADTVKIIFGSTTTNLGGLPMGSYSTNVGASGTVFVEVTKNSPLGWRAASGSNFTHTVNAVSIVENWAGRLQISDDSNPLTRFPAPRGVAVNQDPASPYFGRVYVANSTPGTTAGRSVGRGIYTMKSDLSDSPNGYGNAAQNGGLTNWNFAGSANAPLHVTVGTDGYVYVADFSDGSSIVARLDPNLTVGERVLDYVGGPSTLPSGQNHGSTKRVIATGSLAGGDLKLYTMDEDYMGDCTFNFIASKNSIWRYDILSGPLTNTTCGTLVVAPSPNWTTTGTQDFTIGTNGYVYAIQNRSAGAEPGLFVFDLATGTIQWESLSGWRAITGIPSDNDILVNLHSIAIDLENKFLAINLLSTGNPSGSDCWIIPLVDGIPNLAGRMVLDSGVVTQGRGVAFDRAGNLYTVSSGDAVLRVFSPGGYTVTKTGTDGSFNVVLPTTTVAVTANATSISEGGSTFFTIARSGGGTAVPLTVNYTLSGSAINGSDYTLLPGSVVIKPGETSTNITLSATADGISEPTEEAILTLSSSPNYTLDTPSSAAVSILDVDPPAIQVVAADAHSMFERHTNDYANVTIQRLGLLSAPMVINVNNLTFGGSAVLNTDFIVLSNSFPVALDPGVLSTNISIVSPLDNSVYTGNKSIVVGAAPGPGLGASPSNTVITIIDDENPPETVLYANSLTSASDASNWGLTYANGDLATLGGTDYEASFGYDLVADPLLVGPIAPAPNGATRALRTTVNKLNGSNAGLNLYPTNQSFSGDYAVRFNMNIIIDTASGTTQGPLFGINHDGKQTNWWAGSGVVSGGPWASDGIWYWVSADGGALAGDYILHTGLGGSLPNTGWQLPIAAGILNDFVNVFKGPPAPYSGYGGPGLVANDSPAAGGDTSNWTDVEIKQIGRMVTLYLNKISVLTYSNTTSFTNGTIMLGYSDPFNSIGNAPGAVYYSNLRVVRLGPPTIASISRNGSNVSIIFGSSDGTDTAGSFKLQKSSIVTGSYVDDNTATITQLSDGRYQAITTSTAGTQFFRISKL